MDVDIDGDDRDTNLDYGHRGPAVMIEDGEVFREKHLLATADTLVMQREGEAPRSYDIDDIKLVNPDPWLLGEGYKFTGRTRAAFEARYEYNGSAPDGVDTTDETYTFSIGYAR